MFEKVEKQSFPEREEQVLKFWEDNKIFEKSLKKGGEYFSFYDGPPFATGLPHYGHLLAGTIKDVVPRYKTMKGFCVPRRFGWDCHGLPVEYEIQKKLNLAGAAAIEDFGIANFNTECRNIVLRYTGEWEHTVKRMGRWVDFAQTYRTMDASFMETVWWVFKQMFEKGLVYEGFKVMPMSPAFGTPLSNFEAGENYKEVDDPSLTVTFPLLDEPHTALLAWTTTPWTLVSNMAAMVHPEAIYVKVWDEQKQMHYILAEARLSAYYPDGAQHVVSKLKGSELVGKRYQPLFDYYFSLADQGAFRVIATDGVTLEEGTGIVHAAPAFGEEDFYACQRAGVPMVCPVTAHGAFTQQIPEYTGMFVKEADKDIAKRLKLQGRLVQQGTIRHRYPFCPRSDLPLIYRAMTTWFVAVEKIKEKLLQANEPIYWNPAHIKYGRFGKWLEGARDWAISRNRYWGTPIPIWRAEDGEMHVVGSVAELEELTGAKVMDLHREHIDGLTFKKHGKLFKRVSEVFDCWFESGSMPYAQNHYPFENREFVEKTFPADFIAEGIDQTRCWFYTLTVLSAALFDKPAFKNVIVNGIILAEDGTKMSKRLRNYPPVEEVIREYGADAIRLYLMHSPAVKADDLRFSKKGVELILRQILLPLWSAYAGFFVTYARIYDWKPPTQPLQPAAIIDRWALSLLNRLIKQVEQGMDAYDLSAAVEPFVDFVDQLTNWYIRRSRRRFWSEEASQDRYEAFHTLYTILLTLSKIMAPFVPFLADAMYANLRAEHEPPSVHLSDFPKYTAALRDEPLEAAMAQLQQVVSLGHALRKEHKLKVRQPLPAVHLACADAQAAAFLVEQRRLIEEELNVKEVLFHHDETEFVTLRAKPNFKRVAVLGRKTGALMSQIQAKINMLSSEQIENLLQGHSIDFQIFGEIFSLTAEDVEVQRDVKAGIVAANSGHLTVGLDTTLSEELLIEGLARELVNKISTMRREADFDVVDRIQVTLHTTPRVQTAFEQYRTFIQEEVLAIEVRFAACEGTPWDLNGEPTTIAIQKVESKAF